MPESLGVVSRLAEARLSGKDLPGRADCAKNKSAISACIGFHNVQRKKVGEMSG